MPLPRRAVLPCTLLLGCVALAGWFLAPAATQQPPAPAGKPRLAVLVVFDQMRGDYLTKWRHLYDPEGFGRLQTQGAWFQNCHYPYANTLTGAGHASIVTGCSPATHGIIANSWYDREEGKSISSVQSKKHRLVPDPSTKDKKVLGATPLRRLQPSVGDALMDQTQGKGKVVSISIKDRVAMLESELRAARTRIEELGRRPSPAAPPSAEPASRDAEPGPSRLDELGKRLQEARMENQQLRAILDQMGITI